jgi:choline dehydrogenase-like flavoprotein
VLNKKCKVRGTGNFYLADAPALPSFPSAVPNLTVMMLAERVADWSKSYVDQPSRQMLDNLVL